MNYRKSYYFFFALLIPSLAFANAGTPLMWAGMLHLLFGNALIGVGEGFGVAYLLKAKKKICIPVMIAANYFSAWVGGAFLSPLLISKINLDLYNAWRWFWVMVGVTYLFTLFLEYLFVFLCARKSGASQKRILFANLVVQSASYAVIFGWYWLASGKSLYTDARLASPAEIALPADIKVLFISPSDGNVYELNPASMATTQLAALNSANKNDRLFTRDSTEQKKSVDVFVRLETDDRKNPDIKKVALVSGDGPITYHSTKEPKEEPGTWFSMGSGKLKGLENSAWEFRAGFWPIEGLSAENKATGDRIHLALETPYIAWNARNVTEVSDGVAIFQLGDNQICAFNAKDHKLALLARGRGPTVVRQSGPQ